MNRLPNEPLVGRLPPFKKDARLKPPLNMMLEACPCRFQLKGWTVVTHWTSGKDEKISATTEKAQGVNLSSLFSQAMISPEVFSKPLLMDTYCPLSASLTQKLSRT